MNSVASQAFVSDIRLSVHIRHVHIAKLRGGHAVDEQEARRDPDPGDLDRASDAHRPEDWFEVMRSWWDQRESGEAGRVR